MHVQSNRLNMANYQTHQELRGKSYILKLNDFIVFVFLFVCPECYRLEIGMHVEHVVSRNKTKDLSNISTNSEKGDKMSWPIRFKGFNQIV